MVFRLIFGGGLTAFNRTLLELKCFTYSELPARIFAFNRTLLELKYFSSVPVNLELVSFNRTLLELKFFGAPIGDIE